MRYTYFSKGGFSGDQYKPSVPATAYTDTLKLWILLLLINKSLNRWSYKCTNVIWLHLTHCSPLKLSSPAFDVWHDNTQTRLLFFPLLLLIYLVAITKLSCIKSLVCKICILLYSSTSVANSMQYQVKKCKHLHCTMKTIEIMQPYM